MKNEPVAWMVERTTGTKGYGPTPYVTLLDATKSTYWVKNKIPEGYTVIPLYTHPVKEQDESFDRTASHTAGEYVSHPVKELDEQFKKGFEAGKEEGWKAHKFHHPVKELGYNDIMGTWWETMPNAKSCEGVFEFARAILRKAQEK
jgi:hypothetical protein